MVKDLSRDEREEGLEGCSLDYEPITESEIKRVARHDPAYAAELKSISEEAAITPPKPRYKSR